MKAKYVSVQVKLPEFTVCSEALHHLLGGQQSPPGALGYCVAACKALCILQGLAQMLLLNPLPQQESRLPPPGSHIVPA